MWIFNRKQRGQVKAIRVALQRARDTAHKAFLKLDSDVNFGRSELSAESFQDWMDAQDHVEFLKLMLRAVKQRSTKWV